MLSPRFAFTLLVLAALVACADTRAATAGEESVEGAERGGDSARADGASRVEGALRSGLSAVLIRPEELHLDVESPERDAFRLKIVDSLLARPLAATAFLEEVASARLGDALARPADAAVRQAWSGVREYAALLDAPLAPLAPLARSERPGDSLVWSRSVVTALAAADSARRRALAPLSRDELRLLEERSAELLAQEEDDPSLGVLEFRRREHAKEAFADTVLGICARLDRGALLEMGALAELADEASRGDPPFGSGPWTGRETAPPRALRDRIDGTIRLAIDSPWGWIVFGGAGANRYRGAFAAIIEPGGDDEYELARVSAISARRAARGAAAAETCAVSVTVDFSGNDHYRGRGPGALGAGFLGAGVLYDGAGDDTYEADSPASLGAGWLGVGILWDRAGRDRYLAGAAAEGVGFLGIGILRDDAGDDLYQATLNAQGFGYVAGVGAIEDLAGNDIYVIQPEVTSVLHYNDRSYSLSQGVSFGARPHWSGGVGLLLDGVGNDSYVADLFAQGTAYWYGIGGLWDRDGHDHYVAYQYAQGSGVHRAIGLLLDGAGNDTYDSKGVSQGVGHDLGLGVLRDLAGNDTYSSTDLSQGAGSANGIGFLIDASGLDGYIGKSDRNVLGFGDYRREFQSVGLALDLLGADVRAPRGGEDSLWFGGTAGAGADFPGEVPVEKVWTDTFKIPVARASYSDEEFFLMAASGEPRFSEWQKMGVDSLAARGSAAVPYLVSRLDTEDARERHTLKDIFKKMGDSAIEEMLSRLGRRSEREQVLAAWIAGESQSARATIQLSLMMTSGGPRARAAAMNALGKINLVGADSVFRGMSVFGQSQSIDSQRWDGLEGVLAGLGKAAAAELATDDEVLAKDAAFLLGSLRRSDRIDPLLDALCSTHAMVRTAARFGLARYGSDIPRAILDSRSNPNRVAHLDSLLVEPLARANLLLLAADGVRSEVDRPMWARVLPLLLADLDLADESVAIAAARLVLAWPRDPARPIPQVLETLDASLRSSSIPTVRLLLRTDKTKPATSAR